MRGVCCDACMDMKISQINAKWIACVGQICKKKLHEAEHAIHKRMQTKSLPFFCDLSRHNNSTGHILCMPRTQQESKRKRRKVKLSCDIRTTMNYTHQIWNERIQIYRFLKYHIHLSIFDLTHRFPASLCHVTQNSYRMSRMGIL